MPHRELALRDVYLARQRIMSLAHRVRRSNFLLPDLVAVFFR